MTMVLGEFDFDTLYEAHTTDPYSTCFVIVLFTTMAVMGTLGKLLSDF